MSVILMGLESDRALFASDVFGPGRMFCIQSLACVWHRAECIDVVL